MPFLESHLFMEFSQCDTTALQSKLNEEKTARQRSESVCQEKERQMSMLSVDYRQMQQRLQKLEGEHRQETEKVLYKSSMCIFLPYLSIRRYLLSH